MTGKTKDGVWYFRASYQENGIRKQKYASDPSWKKRDAVEAERAFLDTVDRLPGSMTVDQLHAQYIADNQSKIKGRSIYTHDKIYRLHIKPYLGNCVADEITPKDIARWQSYIVGRQFKNNYSKAIQMHLRTLINYGIRHEYIKRDRFHQDFVRNTLEQKQAFDYWTPEEYNRFIAYVQDPTFEAAFSILYWCGLRKGEMMALTIRDYHNGMISVNKTYDFVGKVTTSPKTFTSIRTVNVIPTVAKMLDDLIESYRLIPGFTEDHLLLGYDRHITASTLQRRMEDACVKSGVKVIRIHDIRHSHVSLLISMGFSGFEIAKRMGHTVDMVNNIYGHWFTESQAQMVNKLEEKAKSVQSWCNLKN